MNRAAALFVVAAFFVLLRVLRVPRLARTAVGRCRQAIVDLRDPARSDEAKGRAARAHARSLLLLGSGIVLAAAIALAVPLALVFVLDAAHVVRIDAVLAFATSPTLLVAATVLALGAAQLSRRVRP